MINIIRRVELMKTKTEYGYILTWHKKIKAIELLGGKCEQCGETRPWVLNFHHKDPEGKEFCIKKINNYRWSKIEKEVKKCSLLCANCHREKHKNIIKGYRQLSKKVYLEFKNIEKCEICSYNKCNNALDFHHIERDKKIFSITDKVFRCSSVEEIREDIQKELDKCIVLCANCHQEKHTDLKKFEKYKNEIYNWKYKELQKPIDKELVIKMYKEGKKQVEIRKELNCAKSTISGIIKNIGK
jgi:ribosomal protein L30E